MALHIQVRLGSPMHPLPLHIQRKLGGLVHLLQWPRLRQLCSLLEIYFPATKVIIMSGLAFKVLTMVIRQSYNLICLVVSSGLPRCMAGRVHSRVPNGNIVNEEIKYTA